MSHAIVCSWCGKTLTEGSEPASHSCCSTCQEIILDEISESTLSRENARELASLAGKLGQSHEEY